LRFGVVGLTEIIVQGFGIDANPRWSVSQREFMWPKGRRDS
jgi:hypothetical protein